MKRLDAGRKVILPDNLIHVLEVFYLPAYSPELNPDEYLNNDLKSAVHGNKGG